MITPQRPDTRQLILDSAIRVANTAGARHLTLDAVVKESGLSKGGVLYHFNNKNALIEGMLQYLVDDAIARREAIQADCPNASFLTCLLQSAECFRPDVKGNVAMAILAAAAENPTLLAPIQAQMRVVLEQLSAEGEDRILTLILWMAREGLLFHELLSLSPLDEATRTAVINRLLEIAQERTV